MPAGAARFLFQAVAEFRRWKMFQINPVGHEIATEGRNFKDAYSFRILPRIATVMDFMPISSTPFPE
jgi:hypothetical protein